MADPLKKTFEILASTENLNVVDALIPALDLNDDTIRTAATSALIQRSSTRGQVEVIRRMESLCPEARSVIENNAPKMETALKQCLIHGDNELRRNGLEIVRLTENYSQMPTLLEMLHDDRNDLHELTAEVVRGLTNHLYERCQQQKRKQPAGKYLRNAQQVRQNVLTSLDQACTEFDDLRHPQDVVESVLMLGDIDHFAVNRVLSQAVPECRRLAGKMLGQSKHPGVMQLILDSMSKNYPHPKALEAIQDRDDVEFLTHLLSWFPKRLSPLQMKNFRRVESVLWLNPRGTGLEIVPPALQTALVSFVASTGLPAECKVGVQEWLVRHGSQAGRLAATDVLSTLDDDSIQKIVFDSLDSEDADVQAWATSQLRSQEAPEVFSLLIERLDSPMDAVRDAAREELASFDVEQMIGLFERLNPETCFRAGQLLKKINPNCLDRLRLELANPIRRKRIRAARAAKAMGLHDRVGPSILAMLEDGDPLVRRTGVAILADVSSTESVAALEQMREDPSQRVREAAVSSLEQISRRTTAGRIESATTHDG